MGAPTKPKPANWQRKLSRGLELDRAPVPRLDTLRDAAELMAEHFPSNTSPANQTPAALLIRAAESGRDADVEAATIQIARLLRFRQWLK